MLQISVAALGLLEENCYIAYNKETKECVLVDPGDDPKRLISMITGLHLHPVAIVITHGHFDHIGAVRGLLKNYDRLSVYVSESERTVLEVTNDNKIMKGRTLDLDELNYLADGTVLDLAGEQWKLMHTPGHSMGSACWYVESSKVLFSGDTLFQGTCGRTDLFSGNMREIVSSIRDVIMTLPDDTLVLPGHGVSTTIGAERRSNFIMRM